jgi:citrate synthase
MAWIAAKEALEMLDVRPQTLYANVSRGRVRAKPDPADPRRSLYLREDVARIAGARTGRPRAQAIAAGAIQWGEPVMPSGISTIARGRLWYRGVDAVALSQSATLEDVAGLLWGCDPPPVFHAPARHSPAAVPADPIGAAMRAVARRAASDLPSVGRSTVVLRVDAARVFAAALDAMIGGASIDGPTRGRANAHTQGHAGQRGTGRTGERTGGCISKRIAAAWGRPAAEDAIRRALVLLADHELNASTFAARVTVSTGASLAAGALSGLCALSGPLHGRASHALRSVLDAARQNGAMQAVRAQATEGRPFAGFGHPLYPHGDPRCSALLTHIRIPALHAEVARAVERVAGEAPNIDFALSAMAAAHRLPDDATIVLFAVARCVGWLAHALEQASLGRIIRPRAHYTGPALPE